MEYIKFETVNDVWSIVLTIVIFTITRWVKKHNDLEHAKTELRKQNRDSQIDALDKRITGLGKSFDTHCKEDKHFDNKFWETMEKFDDRIRSIEYALVSKEDFKELSSRTNAIDKTVEKIYTIIYERSLGREFEDGK
jgi:hypothetical protein